VVSGLSDGFGGLLRGGGSLAQDLNATLLGGNDTNGLLKSRREFLHCMPSFGASCHIRTFSFTKPAHCLLVSYYLHMKTTRTPTLRAFLLVKFKGSREN
jgi:hypothetical protein